jgi:hypothetical protein
VYDGGTQLGFNVITYDGYLSLFKSLAPVAITGDKNRHAIDESDSGL